MHRKPNTNQGLRSCTSNGIIKLPNALDPISSHQFNRDATVEQRWKATCFADKTFCTFAVMIFVLLFQIYLLLSQRECLAADYQLTTVTSLTIARQSTQMFLEASKEGLCLSTSCINMC